MLCLVENPRRKQIAWLEGILAHKGWNRTRLAREAGIDPSTLSKFFNDPEAKAQLQANSIDRIWHISGIRPYETSPAPRQEGLSDREAEPYEFTAETAADILPLAALKNGRNGAEFWIMRSRALEHEGYLPGDILLVDLNATPVSGDAVCAQVYDRHGNAETVMRIYEQPYLVAASSDPAVRRPLIADDDHVVIRGVIIASVRPRRSTLPQAH